MVHSVYVHQLFSRKDFTSVMLGVPIKDWLVGCFGFNSPISVYIEPSPKERETEEKG